jgi:ATP-dependent Lon protease
LEEARVALAALVEEMPNTAAVLDLVLREIALLGVGPDRPLALPPILLVGSPGVGKTRLARRIAQVLGLGFGWTSAAGSADSREMSGTARGWSNGHAAWPVEQLVTLGTANPLLLVDEIDKASARRRNGSVLEALLVHLERDTARVFHDEYVGGPVNLSLISWMLTANDLDALPAPLRSRLHVARVEPPELSALPRIVATMCADLALELELPDPRLLPALGAAQTAMLEEDYARHRDPRRLKRAIRTMVAFGVTEQEGGGELRPGLTVEPPSPFTGTAHARHAPVHRLRGLVPGSRFLPR